MWGQRVEHVLGHALAPPPSVRDVRDVAPKKHMLCVTFRVPDAVGRGEPPADDAAAAVAADAAAVSPPAAALEGGDSSKRTLEVRSRVCVRVCRS